MSEVIPLKASEFEAKLRKLTSEFARSIDNLGSYRSDECARCFDCMFTTGSTDCYKCTYCHRCQKCTACTHCRECVNVHGSTYSVRSTDVASSSYVVMSQNCYECVFCFGCVGLVKKEFHILNQPFKRDEYFKIISELETAFGLKRT